MHGLLAEGLRRRARPLRVAVVGCGWLGSRMLREIARIPNLELALVVTRTPARARTALERIDLGPARPPLVGADLAMLSDAPGIDVVFEATGDVLAGTEAVTRVVAAGIHAVTLSSELDATVGLSLARRARAAGVVYSSADGDQPAVLARLLREIAFQGFRAVVAGNGKTHLDPHQTPEGVRPFVGPGQNPYKICSFTDGSKQATELASVANAFGLSVLKRGGHGPTTTKARLVATFDARVDLGSLRSGYVDYTMGSAEPGQGGPVFVVARHDDPDAHADLAYFNKGAGPFYLFFRDHHLVHFEAASSAIEAAVFGVASLAPSGRFVDAVTVAKRDVPAGRALDGIGGFDCYALVETAETAARERLLPIGLAGYAVARRRLARDEAVTLDDVELADNAAVALRGEQDRLPIDPTPR